MTGIGENGVVEGGDIVEGAEQVDLLKRPRTENLSVHLTSEGQHRGPVDFGVVESRDQVGRVGAGDGATGSRTTREFGVSGDGKRSRALVTDSVEGQISFFLLNAQGVGHTEIGVTDHAEDLFDAPVDHGFGDDIGITARACGFGLEAEINAICADFDRKDLQAVAVAAGRLPGERIEVPTMPWNRNQHLPSAPCSMDPSPRGPPWWRQAVGQCAVSALEIGNRAGLGADADGGDATLGQGVEFEDFVPSK